MASTLDMPATVKKPKVKPTSGTKIQKFKEAHPNLTLKKGSTQYHKVDVSKVGHVDEVALTTVNKSGTHVRLQGDGVEWLSHMDVEDARHYEVRNKYIEAGIGPEDRVKLQDWAFSPEPEHYLTNKHIYDNPDYFNQITGTAIYPGTPESALGRVDGSVHKYGFLNGKYKESVLSPGTTLNRIGSNPDGRYFSPKGASFGEKSLPPFMKSQPNSDYIVLKEIPIKEGIAAPWFDEPGMGIQYLSDLTIEELEKGNYIFKIE